MKKNYFFIFILFLVTKSVFAQTRMTGEIRIYTSYRGVPIGWLKCDGSLLSISEYETLFNIIGKKFGGDGITTFALPDLRGRVPVGTGRNPSTGTTTVLASSYGKENVTLIADNLPQHTHQYQIQVNGGVAQTNVPVAASNIAISGFDSGKVTIPNTSYTTATTNLIDNTGIVNIKNAGGQSTPISIVKPMCVITYMICYDGVYPTPQD